MPEPQDPRGRPFAEPDLSLRHLEAALMRVDVLLHRAVLRWQEAGQDPNDPFRGQYVSDAEAGALLKRPFATNWGETVPLREGEKESYTNALARVDQHVRALAESARQEGHTLRLEHLTAAFNLDSFDRDALLICLAPTLDLRYERIYGYLQDDVTRKRPTVSIVLDLLCLPGSNRLTRLSRFADDAPLFRHHVLEHGSDPAAGGRPLLGQSLRVDATIVAWLLGHYRPHDDLATHARLLRPEESEADRLLALPLRLFLEDGLDVSALVDSGAASPILVFYGPDRAGQKAAARFTASRLNRPLLDVDLPGAVSEADVSPLRALRLALRDARLTGAIPYVFICQNCPMTGQGEGASPEMLAELCAYPDLAIVAAPQRWQPSEVDRERAFFWFEFPIPAYAQRLALWQHFLGQDAPAEEPDVADLAGQFTLTTGQIRDVVAAARDAALQRGEALAPRDLFEAARACSSARLSSLAQKIDPRYGWEDIVLPADQLAMLREIVDTVRKRSLVLETWGVGRKLASSGGVTILFAGPPGTGKTMAAEVMAAELGLDLYKIDLSSIVSKYIGETEKNLERIFNEAEHSSAILFFDEADALFGKRSEVRDSHDRYANIEISYLLQRMEAYDGVTILATNLRANLDEAFTRRLQFAVDFPFPEREYRERIWRTLFPPDVPREPDLDFGLMARRFKLAGGNIRNIIVNAAYLAAADGQEVTMDHLLHGTRRELQKMGRLLPEDDLTIDRGSDRHEP